MYVTQQCKDILANTVLANVKKLIHLFRLTLASSNLGEQLPATIWRCCALRRAFSISSSTAIFGLSQPVSKYKLSEYKSVLTRKCLSRACLAKDTGKGNFLNLKKRIWAEMYDYSSSEMILGKCFVYSSVFLMHFISCEGAGELCSQLAMIS